MSFIGPTLFITRLDREELDSSEQNTLLRWVTNIFRSAGYRDNSGLVEPWIYRYGDWYGQARTLVIQIAADKQLAADLQQQFQDQRQDKIRVLELASRIESMAPATYSFDSEWLDI